MKQFHLIFSIIILSIFPSFVNAQNNENYINKIDSILELKQPFPFNGVILLTKNDRVEYSKVIGFKNLEKRTPLTIDSQFEIMSNTKQITSVLILKQVEKGKINLDSPIKKYLPELQQSWAESVTVHQLLNHTHGIESLDKPLLFEAGTQFKYGNLSNNLLGKILEQVTNKKYSQLANDLFKKLKMNNTTCYTFNDNPNLANGYIFKNNQFNKVEHSMITEENSPADGVISTANDLAIWNNALHNGKLLSKKSYQLMTTESVKSQHNTFGENPMGYGYNIRIAEQNGIKYFGHTGLGDGFSSLNIYIPQTKSSLIILENQMTDDSNLYYFFENMIKNTYLNSF